MKIIKDLPRSRSPQPRGPSPKSWWPKATVAQASGSAGDTKQDNAAKDEAGPSKKKSRKTKQAPADPTQSGKSTRCSRVIVLGQQLVIYGVLEDWRSKRTRYLLQLMRQMGRWPAFAVQQAPGSMARDQSQGRERMP